MEEQKGSSFGAGSFIFCFLLGFGIVQLLYHFHIL
jgi:hypothetical protein